ncbi:putative ESX-1 scaffolding and assembly protein SaeB [Salinibacterium xinjiangense]|uniref:Uncharacterized protein n=1 Tax=Salinibacterium xinjiangense TaxID=386302 RepID=A0A2C8YT99_9MICO|nr:hypothetical protein [Salinibacterium xinjiangense]GGK99786.1 putative ESX-1 scaffolding and assembly protein SaeB [Salinibacterium xinjiangense]SOE53867.1 hypothetical protein SAMN06296378_0621 [Salinibacterium xinjiangense]
MADERWPQLTYASFDAGTGAAGGWGVKDVSGVLTTAETEGLRSRVVTLFGAIDDIPQFPSHDEIANLPRRLTYAPVSESKGYGYWHSVPSGLDGTGRPGNVFSHVLLDRRPDEQLPSLRPITLWRSPSWLTPFGQQEILAAAVQPGAPSVGSAVARASIIDFLLDPVVFRGATLTVLLDAVAAAVAGGPRVIIVTETPDVAALWIGAVSQLMAPRTSRGLPFSVFERTAGLGSVLRRGALIVGVPHADAEAAVKIDNVVVIDDRTTPSLGDLDGEPHRVGDAVIVVTEWSVIAEVALQEPDLASAVLDRLDAVCTELADTDLAPAWPLAMVVALMPDDLADGTREAARVLRDTSPAGLRTHPAMWAAISAATQGLFGSTVQQALDQVEATSAESSPIMHDLAVAVYQERVLESPEFLSDARLAPVYRASTGSGDSVSQRALAAVRRLGAGEVSSTLPREVLRLADWIIASGLVAPGDVALQAPLETLVRERVLPVLLDPLTGPTFVGSVGPVSEAFAGDWVRPLVEAALATGVGLAGSRVAPSVVQWLFPVPPALDTGRPLSDLDLEYVIEGCATGRSELRSVRAASWLALLQRGAAGEDNPRSLFLVDAALPWSAREVLSVEAHHPGGVPAHLVMRALIDVAPGPDLTEFVNLIALTSDRVGAAPLLAVSQARMLAVRVAAGGTMSRAEAWETFETSAELFKVAPNWMDGVTLISSYIMGISGRPEYDFTRERFDFLRSALGRVTLDAFEVTIKLHAAAGAFSPLDFPRAVQLALLGAPDCPVPPLDGQRGIARLAGACDDDSDGRLIVVVATSLAEEGVGKLEWDLGVAENLILAMIPTGRLGDKRVVEFDRFARDWWKYFKSFGPAPGKTRASRRRLFGITASDKENI